MSEDDRPDFGGLWDGLTYIALGLLATSVFSGNSVDTGGIVASIALVGIGVAAVLAPEIAPLLTELNRRWTGLFWVLCGIGILGIGTLNPRRWVSGVVLGGGFVIYGLLTAAGR